MENIAYYNGKYSTIEELKIPITDRCVFLGDGVYELVYARGGEPFALADHLHRLKHSLELTEIESPMPMDEIERFVRDAIKQVHSHELSVYFQVTRGLYYRQHAYPPRGTPSNFLLYARPVNLPDIRQPVKLCTLPDLRWGMCTIKSINLMPNCMAMQQAVNQGCYESILHRCGVVTECASSNVFILTCGTLQTAPESNTILSGITRAHFLAIAKGLDIPTREKSFTLGELYAADEVIVTNTLWHGLSAESVDGKPVKRGAPELLRRLQVAYTDFVIREVGP